MVTIVDPHIKHDSGSVVMLCCSPRISLVSDRKRVSPTRYYVHNDATKLDVYIKKEDGVTIFDGWCWVNVSRQYSFASKFTFIRIPYCSRARVRGPTSARRACASGGRTSSTTPVPDASVRSLMMC